MLFTLLVLFSACKTRRRKIPRLNYKIMIMVISSLGEAFPLEGAAD